MSKAVFFVDGFNLYHALDYTKIGGNPFRYRKYKWLSLTKLAEFYLPPNHTLASVLFFTTVVTWEPGKEARHRLLIRAQEHEGVTVIEGEFKKKDIRCKICKEVFKGREEKRTDVNIAVELLRLAHYGQYDTAIVLTGDTDLIPALDAVRQLHNHIKIAVVLPIGKSSKDMKKASDYFFQMTELQLIQSVFPDPVVLTDGTSLARPDSWK
jgi:uncharacterized LabA/DUF88 family protein